MKKMILLVSISSILLLNACSISHTYPGKYMSYVSPIGYEFTCGKTPSQESRSLNPPPITANITANLKLPDDVAKKIINKQIAEIAGITRILEKMSSTDDGNTNQLLEEIKELLTKIKAPDIKTAITECDQFLNLKEKYPWN